MTETITPAKIALLREEIVPRLVKTVEILGMIAETKTDIFEQARILRKRDAVQKVITEQGERLNNIQDEKAAINMAAFISGVAKFDGADPAGTDLAISHILSYLR